MLAQVVLSKYTFNRPCLSILAMKDGPLEFFLIKNTDFREDVFLDDLARSFGVHVTDSTDENGEQKYINNPEEQNTLWGKGGIGNDPLKQMKVNEAADFFRRSLHWHFCREIRPSHP